MRGHCGIRLWPTFLNLLLLPERGLTFPHLFRLKVLISSLCNDVVEMADCIIRLINNGSGVLFLAVRLFYRLADEKRETLLVASCKCDWRAAFARDDLITGGLIPES